jgi:hypothetical protein
MVSRSEVAQEAITIRACSFSILVTSDSGTCLGLTPVSGPTATIAFENSLQPDGAMAGCKFMAFGYT